MDARVPVADNKAGTFDSNKRVYGYLCRGGQLGPVQATPVQAQL